MLANKNIFFVLLFFCFLVFLFYGCGTSGTTTTTTTTTTSTSLTSTTLGAGGTSTTTTTSTTGTTEEGATTTTATSTTGTTQEGATTTTRSTTTTTAGLTTTTTTTSSTTTLHSSLNWIFSAEPFNHSAPAIGDDGTIFIGTSRQNVDRAYLYAINSNGTQKWKYQFRGSEEVDGGCAIAADGTVYCISKIYIIEQDCSYYLNAFTQSGTLEWRYAINSSVQQNYAPEGTPAISSNEVVYVPGKNRFCAVSSDGGLLWEYSHAECNDYVTPAIGASGTIYANTGYGLVALNPDGSQKWLYTYDDRENYYSPPAIGSQETIYFGAGGSGVDNDEYFYALNSSGTLEWKVSSEGLAISAPPIVGSDGTIYIGTTSKGTLGRDGQCGIFFAFNPDGTKKWSYDVSDDHTVMFPDARTDIYAAAAIGDDGTIYFNTEGNYLYAMNPDGTVNTKYDFFEVSPRSSGSATLLRNSMAIADDGTIYCADYYHYYITETNYQEGAVYALDSDCTGLADGPWPKYMNNNKNTGRSD